MTQESEGTILLLMFTSGSSFLSTFTIILYYLIRRRLFSSYTFDLVLMFCISDFFFSSVNFLRSIWMLIDPEAQINQFGCYFIGIYIQTWMMSSFICTSTIQYAIYEKVIKQETVRKKSAFKRFWVINYLLPLIGGIVLYASGSIGHIGPFENTFCFINAGDKLRTDIMMIVFYYTPYMAILLFNSIVTGLIIRHYRKLREKQTNILFLEYLKLLAYPIILFISFFPVIFCRILSHFDIQNDTFLRIAYCVDNLIGFFNALVYFLVSLNPCQIEKFERFQSMNQTLISQQNKEISFQQLQQNGIQNSYDQQQQQSLISPNTNIIRDISKNQQTDDKSEDSQWSI